MGQFVLNIKHINNKITLRKYYYTSPKEQSEKRKGQSNGSTKEQSNGSTKEQSNGSTKEQSNGFTNEASKEHSDVTTTNDFCEQSIEQIKGLNNEPVKDYIKDSGDGTQNAKSEEQSKGKERGKAREKTEEEKIKNLEKNKRRQKRDLSDTMNLNYSTKGFVIVFSIDEDNMPDEELINNLKKEFVNFINRLNLRIVHHPKYNYIISKADVNQSNGDVYIARPHIHAIMESEDFRLCPEGNDILFTTKNNETVKLSKEWGRGKIFVEKIRSAVDTYAPGQLNADEIKYLKDNNVPADLGGLAAYYIEQSIETKALENGNYKKAWRSSLHLEKPDKGYTIPWDFGKEINIPKDLKFITKAKYGKDLPYIEEHYFKTNSKDVMEEIKKQNPDMK